MDDAQDYVLKGTTLRIYRLLFRTGSPMGLHSVQRSLKLSSTSVAEYHIKKLLNAGLVQEKEGGYVVNRVVFENILRIRKTLIPLQIAYLAFFLSTMTILLVFFRPVPISSLFFFAVATNVVGVAIVGYEAFKAVKSV